MSAITYPGLLRPGPPRPSGLRVASPVGRPPAQVALATIEDGVDQFFFTDKHVDGSVVEDVVDLCVG